MGLDHIVELNSTLNQFWLDAGVNILPDEFAFDPRVLYDPFSDRWLATGAYKLDNPETTFLVAASNSSDPTQGWTGFELDPPGDQVDVDYPTLGYNSEGVFLAYANKPGDLPVGGAIYVLPKTDLINGSIANVTLLEISSLNSLGDTIQPVVDLDNTGQPHLLYRALTTPGLFDRDIISGSIDAPVLEEDGEGDFKLSVALKSLSIAIFPPILPLSCLRGIIPQTMRDKRMTAS